MTALTQRFFRNTSGATAVEYGLLAGLIGLVVFGSIKLMAPKLNATLGKAVQ